MVGPKREILYLPLTCDLHQKKKLVIKIVVRNDKNQQRGKISSSTIAY